MNNFLTRFILIATIGMLSTGTLLAQNENVAIPANAVKPKSDWKDKIFFGGGLGASFGSNNTYVEVSPLIGYRITEKLSAGLGISYIYFREKFQAPGKTGQLRTYTYENHNYGGRIFGRYFVTDDIFLHSEFESLNREIGTLNTSTEQITYRREFIPALFVGGGYTQRMGGNSSLYILALWEIIEDKNTPYQNPVIRIGFNVGL